MVLADSHRISRVLWYLGVYSESQRAFAYRAFTCCGRTFQTVRLACWLITLRTYADRVPQHLRTQACSGLGSSPFARRYLGNRGFFLFLGVLRCLTSPRWLRSAYEFSGRWRDMTPVGFPHSDIPGSKTVCVSPRLIAAYHVLRRLLVPRHPLCTLSSLTGSSKVLQLCIPSVSYSIVKERTRRVATRGADFASSKYLYRAPSGRPSRFLVEIAGFEPAASGLQSRRSPS